MKLRIIFLGLLSSYFFCLNAQDTLLLFHPTAYNLHLIDKLVHDGMLNLEGYHVLGVYHSQEIYDYEPALEFASENALFSLLEIKEDLGPENIYEINACSPRFETLFRGSGGALFMGGPDIPPLIYGEKVHLLTRVTDPYRHYLEASYLFHLLGGSQDPVWIPYLEQRQNYLVSGICLGMQTMNVATGGTLIQDIPTEVYGLWTAEDLLAMPDDQVHRNYHDLVRTDSTETTSYHFHRLRLMKGSFLQRNMKIRKGRTPLVLSSHHQAIEKPGKGWTLAASSMDGKIIEAISHEEFPNVFGVQFHPEKPGLFDPTINHPVSGNEMINFREVIIDTDSYEFHLEYWKYLGGILQENRN